MMVQDRKGLGMKQLQDAVDELVRTGNSQQNLRGLASTINAHSPQIYLDIDRTKARSFQVPVNDVFQTLTAYLGSSFVNLFNKYNQVYQVYIQADNRSRVNPKDIGNLNVRNGLGEMVPLSALIHVRVYGGTGTDHALQPLSRGAYFRGCGTGIQFRTGPHHEWKNWRRSTLPQGMGYEWTTTSYQEKQVGHEAYLIYAISIILVFMVLAALFESWTSPAAVILAVPLALVGVLLALLIRGYDNNLYTQIGLVLMIALASKNAILIVEFARDLQKEGHVSYRGGIEATSRRFRPIMMTSFAFILGVAPLLLANGAGAASQRAIGTVVFGGMLSSTLLAIPFVPVFYVFIESVRERIREKQEGEAGSFRRLKVTLFSIRGVF